MSTIKQIAAQLNITPTAVSYALNGRTDKVSGATLQRVLQAARDLGYQPNAAARALRTGRTYTIAILTRSPQSPYYGEVLHHLVQQVLAHPYQVLIQRVDRPQEGSHTGSLPGAEVDGYLVVDATRTTAALRRGAGAGRSEPPVVALGAFYDTTGDFVGIDLASGGRDAVAHLVAIGCRRIGYLIDAETFDLEEARQQAYVSVLAEAGQAPEFLSAPDQTRTAAYQFVRTYVSERGCPDGLFCLNDEMAIGAHRALRDLGLRVPDDVALVGCDGIQEAEYANPPLTTVVQPIEEMCRQAWEFLERRIACPTLPPQQTKLAATLAVRASSCRQGSG